MKELDDLGSEEIRNVHADVERTTTAVPLAICRSKEIRTAGSQVPTTRYLSLYRLIRDTIENDKFLPMINHRSSIDRIIFGSSNVLFILYYMDFYFASIPGKDMHR